MKKIEFIKLKMEIEKALKVYESLKDISEKRDRFYLEASLIQTSMDSDELEGQIKNVASASELLYKACLPKFVNQC